MLERLADLQQGIFFFLFNHSRANDRGDWVMSSGSERRNWRERLTPLTSERSTPVYAQKPEGGGNTGCMIDIAPGQLAVDRRGDC